MNSIARVVCLVASAIFLVPAASRAAEIQLLPHKVVLTGSEARQRLLVEQIANGRHSGQVETELTWKVSDPAVASVADGTLVPLSNGSTTITVTSPIGSATAEVSVEHFERPHAWSFRNHVQAVLARSGCNGGACHGALAGKGGFRLSLRGYDSDADYFRIAKQARGRRIELSDPGRSLVLAKPTGALPHKGGLRFDTDSHNYRVVSEWIVSGATPPAADDPVVESIEVLPSDVRLAVGQTQDMIVRAHYSDGHSEDVTHWVKFSSADETVAKVDDNGRVTVIGHGAGAISAWFASRIVLSRVTSPYAFKIPVEVYASQPRRNFIDEQVLAKLQDLHLRPSPGCSDEQFIRRSFLDTIGTLPTSTEVREFLADKNDGKRDRLIESLLARPEFVDFWAYKWSDVLTISGNRLRPKGVEAYYKWVHNEVAENRPWDEFARRIVTSVGSSVENGATNFYALHQDPENMAENVSKAFLSLSIACAKCHNHPLEKWTNDQYYAFANLFSRVRAKGWGGDYRNGDGVRTLYVVPTGELVQPRTGKAQPPTPLDGEPVAFDSTTDRRTHVARWLTSPDNPYFTRAVTNRVWHNFFGVGLVEEVDDLRVSNPASNEELLTAASQHLIEHKYDLKSLMRTILQSHTYQRSSLPLKENRDEHRFYSRYYPRRLMAEVMLDAISQTTDVPTAFTHIGFPGGDRQETKLYETGTRAIQLYDSAVESYFLSTFGRNAREITCECERTDEPSMVQVLHIANGKTINNKLKAEGNRITALLKTDLSPADLIDEVFLVCLSRRPTDKEKAGLIGQFADLPKDDAEQKRILVEDVFWAILSTREFLFNH